MALDEVNSILSTAAIPEDEVDGSYAITDGQCIQVLEESSAEDASHPDSADAVAPFVIADLSLEESPHAAEPDNRYLEKSADPVRAYLREMGSVPLLTRERLKSWAKCLARRVNVSGRLKGKP